MSLIGLELSPVTGVGLRMQKLHAQRQGMHSNIESLHVAPWFCGHSLKFASQAEDQVPTLTYVLNVGS